MKKPKPTFEQLDAALKKYLETATPKAAESLKGQIKRLKPRIDQMLKAGFKLGEIHQVLLGEGLDCSFSTFKAYLRSHRKVQKVVSRSAQKNTMGRENQRSKPNAAGGTADSQSQIGGSGELKSDSEQTDMFPEH